MAERITLGWPVEVSTDAPLELASGRGLEVASLKWPWPERELQAAAATDAEGEAVAGGHYRNFEVALGLRVREPSDEAAATNYITNPSFEPPATGGTAEWVANAGSPTFAQVSSPEPPAGLGAYCLQVATDATASSGIRTNSILVPDNTNIAASVYLQGAGTVIFFLEERSFDDSTSIGTTSSSTIVLTSAWQRVSLVRAFGDEVGQTQRRARVGVRNNAAGAKTWYLDGVLLEQAAASSPYFDGDTPGCRWSGARHSTSALRPAAGGTRFYQILDDLQGAVARLSEEGGRVRRSPDLGLGPLTFDVVSGELDLPHDWRSVLRLDQGIELRLLCRPFGRGDEITLSDTAETTLPYLVKTLSGIEGHIPALGRLILDDDQGQAQMLVDWGLESRQAQISDANAGPFYQAESCQLLGSTDTAAGPSGASGGSCARNQNLPAEDYAPIVSTNASAPTFRTHKGRFRVVARIAPGTAGVQVGTTTVRLAWDIGPDWTAPTLNDPVELAPEGSGQWFRCDLGVVEIPDLAAKGGTQAWEGRLLAKSTTAGDDLFVDFWELIPLERAGRAEGLISSQAPGSLSAFEEFDQGGSPALTGQVAPLGGTWTVAPTGAGPAPDTDDFTIDSTNDYARRIPGAAADTGPRIVTLGTTAYGATLIQLDQYHPSLSGTVQFQAGIAARLADMANYLRLVVSMSSGGYYWRFVKRVAGTETVLWQPTIYTLQTVINTWLRMKLLVLTDGTWALWIDPKGTSLPTEPTASGRDSALASGGALQTGRIGLFENRVDAHTTERRYDHFYAWVPSADVAVQPSQSIEIRHDAAIREIAAGGSWAPVSRYLGDRFLIPPAGREQRDSRLYAKASRGNYAGIPDAGIDDASMLVKYRPRFVVTSD